MKASKTTKPATTDAFTPKASSRFSPRSFHDSQESKDEDPPESKTTELSNGDNLRKSMKAYRQPLTIKGKTHTIMYREIGTEMVLGVASNWDDGSEIRQELRHADAYTPAVALAWNTYSNVHKETKLLRRQYNEQDRIFKKSRARKKMDIASQEKKKKALSENIKLGVIAHELQQKQADERTAFHGFLAAAIASNDTVVASVLGAKMPARESLTDVAPADANHPVRYHTGTAADPIPLVWYKPIANYQNVALRPDPSPLAAPVNIQPWSPVNPTVTANGKNYQFGVAGNNQPMAGRVWQNMPKHGKTRTRQQEYNNVFSALGHDLSANNEDGDHVRDLGFGGQDKIENFWPLHSVINRFAYTGWRSSYNLNYKKKQTIPGTYEIVKAPLNSGTLVGKHFRIKNHQAAAQPAENGTSTAGSDTGWGVPSHIIDNTGGVINEH